MKVPHSISSSPDEGVIFSIQALSFGTNGPYHLDCSVECIGITGDSGVGKTLFLRALADLDKHDGRIVLKGKDCVSYPAPQWRRHVALVPAESRWWHPDVKGHLPADADSREIRKMIRALGFEDDVLSWQVNRLSTGEKQRLALVRVLARKPSVLLLDEAGSGLDHRNTLLLEKVVAMYQDTCSAPVLWVSHDQDQLERVCDRLVVLRRDGLSQIQIENY